MADELTPQDAWNYQPWCNKADTYKGSNRVYPASHGPDCPGHCDLFSVGPWAEDPDNRPLPRPEKWWGYSDEVVEVDERYL